MLLNGDYDICFSCSPWKACMKFVSSMINNQRFFIGKRGVLSATHPL